jgi:hypothetical protein
VEFREIQKEIVLFFRKHSSRRYNLDEVIFYNKEERVDGVAEGFLWVVGIFSLSSGVVRIPHYHKVW